MNHFEKKFEQKTGLNFQKFYKEHKPKLTWYLSKWTKDLEVAEDFAQLAFVKALTSIDGYNGEKSQAQTWLYTIAINFVKKDYQDKKKMPSISIDKELANEATMSMFIPSEDDKKKLIKEKEWVAKAEIARDAIYSMPDKQHKYRTVLIMRQIKNMTYNEIAESLNLNLSTVKSQIKQGRALIAKKIEKKCAYIDEHGLE